MKIKIIAIICTLLAVAAFSQSEGGCSISGYITAASSGEAIAGANLKIEGEPFGAAANIHGFYNIPRLPKGLFTLNVSALGYETITRQITCTGEPQRLDFELVEQAIMGEEVVIEAQRVGGMLDPYVGHTIIEQKMILGSPGLAEPDLFRSIQFLPGVLSLSDYSSGLYIWGSSPSGNMVLLDNIEVYNPSHLFGFMSTFIVDAVREVNLVKGGYPAKWGGRLGSVLEVTNKDGNRKEFEGMAELSFLSGQALVEGPVGNGSFMIAGRRTWIDYATKAMENGGIIPEGEDLPYHFYDFQSRINQDFSPRDKLTLSFYSGDDIFQFEDDPGDTVWEDEDNAFDYRWGNVTSSLQWKHIYSDRLFGHTVLAASRFRAKFFTGDGYYDRDNIIGDLTLKSDMSYFYSDKHTISYGGILKWREIRNHDEILIEENRYDPETDTWVDTTAVWDNTTNASLIAIYGQEEFNPNIFWNLQLGLRAEFAVNGNYFRVGPRFSAQRRIDDLTTLRFATGQYYQYIHLYSPGEEMGFEMLDFWIPVDDNIKPASAQHLVIGIDTDHLPVHLAANAYLKHMDHIIAGREAFIMVLDDNLHSQFYEGKGWAAGLDMLVEGEWNRIGGWAGYSLGFVEHQMGDTADGLNNGEYYPPKYDRLHSFKFSLGYRLSNRLNLMAAYNFGTGQPYTEPEDWELEYWYAGSDSFFYPAEGGAYHNARLPYYSRFDLGLRWKMVDKDWKMFMFFQVLNLFGRENYLYRDPYEKVNDEIYYDEVTMIPRIPYFGFRAEF